MKSARIPDWHDRGGRGDEPLPMPPEQCRLESRMDTALPSELAVVIENCVKRHVGIRDVVRQHGGKEKQVEAAGDPASPVRFEGAPQAVMVLLDPPRQGTVRVDAFLAKPGQSRRVISWQFPERIPPVTRPIQIEEVMLALLLEPRCAPRVRIDDALDNHDAMVLKQRAELCWQ